MQNVAYLDQINVMPSVKQCLQFWNSTFGSSVPSDWLIPLLLVHTHCEHFLLITLSHIFLPVFSVNIQIDGVLWKGMVSDSG